MSFICALTKQRVAGNLLADRPKTLREIPDESFETVCPSLLDMLAGLLQRCKIRISATSRG